MSLLARTLARASRSAPVATGCTTIHTQYKDGLLSSIITAEDAKPDDTRLGRGDYIHASSLLSFCPRRHLYAQAEGGTQKSVDGAMRIVWKLGRAAESHVRGQLIAATGGAGIYGQWSCPCGRASYEGLHSSTHPACPTCGKHPEGYSETLLLDEEYGVSGNPDFIMLIGGEFVIVECKSINREAFGKLLAPTADHALQSLLYRRLLQRKPERLAGVPVAPYTLVLYISKDYQWGKSPYREFRVEPSETLVDNLLAPAAELRGGRKIFPRICSCPKDVLAKDCPFVVRCLSSNV